MPHRTGSISQAVAAAIIVAGAQLCAQTFDFENGIAEWTRSGSAFDSQPYCSGRMASEYFAPVKLGGTYWRDLNYPLGQHGRCAVSSGVELADSPEGTLISPEFPLSRATPYLSFRLGGTADIQNERFELQVRVPAAGADALEQRIRDWSHANPPAPNGGYIAAVIATGNGQDALRQEIVAIPPFLWGLTARVRLVDSSPRGHIVADYIRFTVAAPEPLSTPVWGYADYHTHPMSYLAFGGLRGTPILFGNPGGNVDDYPDAMSISKDIPHCPPRHGGGYTAEQFINSAQLLPSRLGFSLTALLFAHNRSGGPEFKGFPSQLMGAHEQMHITQIYRNYQGGLRLMVALATDDMGAEYLTGYVKNNHVDLVSEKTSLEAQLAGMQALADKNSRWMQIAYTAADAREIIRHNKLAVIMGVEVDQLGSYGFPTPADEVKYLWDKGVRAVTPIHAVDNSIGGPAVLNEAYNWLNDLLNRGQIDATTEDLHSGALATPKFFQIEEEKCTGTPSEIGECVMYKLGTGEYRVAIMRPIFSFFRRAPWIDSATANSFDTKLGQKNQMGLTAQGPAYIAALMDRGMILDTAHMSDKSVAGTYQAIRERLLRRRPDCPGFSFDVDSPSPCDADAYPAIVSHAHFREQAVYDKNEPISDFLPKEYDISKHNLGMIRRVGGVVGPFVTEGRTNRPNIPGIADDCGMSSKNFAFSFHYALDKLGENVGMATDFTFIPLMAPRFGKHACEGFKMFREAGQERSRHPEKNKSEAQRLRVVYRGASDSSDTLCPYKMGDRTYDFNTDGLAHYGLVPDMLQDLRNIGLPRDDFQALFSSAEAYLRMWEKAERLSNQQ